MLCKYCGKELKRNAKFCPHCGKAAEPVSSLRQKSGGGLAGIVPKKSVYCGHCGKEIPGNKGFCPFCGEKINTASAEAKSSGMSENKETDMHTSQKKKSAYQEWQRTRTYVTITPDVLAGICSSSLTLVLCILLTAQLFLRLSSNPGIIAILVAIPRIVICIGCWIAFSEGHHNKRESIGLSMISGGLMTYVLFFGIPAIICLVITMVYTLIGVVGVLLQPGKFSIYLWCFAGIGGLMGGIVGAIQIFLNGLDIKGNPLGEKSNKSKAFYVLLCVIICSLLLLLSGTAIFCALGNEVCGFCLFAGLVFLFPSYYWAEYQGSAKTAKTVMRGESTNIKASTAAMFYLILIAVASLIKLYSGTIIKNQLFSWLFSNFQTGSSDLLSDYIINNIAQYILSLFPSNKTATTANILSIAVTICAVVILGVVRGHHRSDDIIKENESSITD